MSLLSCSSIDAELTFRPSSGGIGFPVIITLLIPVRYYWVPKLFTPEELKTLDAPTANSAAVLVSLGGPLQPEHGSVERRSARAGDVEDGSREKEATGLRRRAVREEQGEPKVVSDGLQKTTSITR